METELTVYVVDDDPAVVKAISALIEMIGMRVVECTSAPEFLEVYKPSGPACLVLDVRMPGMSGLELQRRLAATGTTLPVIIVTGHADVRMAVEAMKLGAIDFLEKPFRAQELCDCIQKAVQMERENWLRRARQESADRRIQHLTNAEREVMELVLLGKTNKMIAEELGLSLRAVEDRRARMMRKVGVESRAELAHLLNAARVGADQPS
jgi:FixJ family two-component response regulator